MKKSRKNSEGMESLINQESFEFPEKPNDLTNVSMQAMGTKYMEKAKQIEKKNFIVKLFSAYINHSSPSNQDLPLITYS